MINVDKYMVMCSYADLSSVPICTIYTSENCSNILLFSTNCHFCLVCDENICQNKTQHQ